MLGKVQNTRSNQIYFASKNKTVMQAFTELTRKNIDITNKYPSFSAKPAPWGIIHNIFCIGGTAGVLKIASSIIKLPVKMMEEGCKCFVEIINESKSIKSVIKAPGNMLNAAKESLTKDTKELRSFIKAYSDLVTTELEVNGHTKSAKFLKMKIF